MKIVYRHKVFNEISFINNLIVSYSYNFSLDMVDLNYTFISNVFLLYKIRTFQHVISLFKLCKFNKNIKNTHTITLHSHFFQKLSFNSFIYFLENFVYLQVCNVRILEKIFFELEFFYEKKNLKTFFSTLFSICEIVFLDRSIVEHFLSYFKSCNDIKCDLNGYGQIHLTRIDLNYPFISNVYEKFHIYQGKILTKRKKTPSYLFLLNKNFKLKFYSTAFKIKIKQKKFPNFLNVNYSKFSIISCKKINWSFFRKVLFFQKDIVYKYFNDFIIHKSKLFYWILSFFRQEKLFSYFILRFIYNYNRNNIKKYLTYINCICNLNTCVFFLSKYINVLKYNIDHFLNGIFFFNHIYLQKIEANFFYANCIGSIFNFSIVKNKFRILYMFFFINLVLFERIFYKNRRASVNYIRVFQKNTFNRIQMHFQIVYKIVKRFFFSNILFFLNKKYFIKNLLNSKNTIIYSFYINIFFQMRSYELHTVFSILNTDFIAMPRILSNNLAKNLIISLKSFEFFQRKVVSNYRISDKENDLVEYVHIIPNSFNKWRILSNFIQIFFLTKQILILYKIKYKKLIMTKKLAFFCN
nr:hypothetical protein CparaKRNrm3_p080 [Cryptomonas paramecium]